MRGEVVGGTADRGESGKLCQPVALVLALVSTRYKSACEVLREVAYTLFHEVTGYVTDTRTCTVAHTVLFDRVS